MNTTSHHERISRDEMFMRMAELVALRSTCSRARVGAVLVKDNRVISMGYGGAPSGMKHCTEVGCEIGPNGGCIRTIHAEANAVAFAARSGIAISGSVLYTTLSPCRDCAKLIINAGVEKVIFREKYRDDTPLKLLEEVNIRVEHKPQRQSGILVQVNLFDGV